MKPTVMTFKELREQAREEFYKVEGYYPTVDDIVRLTEEARADIQNKRVCHNENDSFNNSIPEFKRFNIVESEIENVI